MPPPRTAMAPDVQVRPIRLAPPATALELCVEAVPGPDGGWEVVVHRWACAIDGRTADALAGQLWEAWAELADDGSVGEPHRGGASHVAGSGAAQACPVDPGAARGTGFG